MKYKKGDKFIFEIENVKEHESTPYEMKLKECEDRGTIFFAVTEDILDQLQKMEEAEPTMTAEEAWETAKQIIFSEEISCEELEKIFGTRNHFAIMRDYAPQEAKAKIEAWKKAKEEIKVGDVVRLIDRKGVVYKLSGKTVWVMWNDACVGGYNKAEFKKTGEHIDIEAVLKQLGE